MSNSEVKIKGWTVGSSTRLEMDYTKGPSEWQSGVAIVIDSKGVVLKIPTSTQFTWKQ
jgi:L-aminopeptidase/D-esterase-like protein